MSKYFLVAGILLACAYTAVAQQRLVFTLPHANKTVIVKQGDMMRVLYKGYLGQVQDFYGRVENINDSFVAFENNWKVRVKDIIGFRRFSKYRDVLKGATEVITLTASIIAVPLILSNNPQMSFGQRLGATFGIGLAGSLVNQLLFPSQIKYYMSAGWQVSVAD